MTRSRQTADWGSRAGLAKIVPSSVAVGSGTGSASTTGTVTFSGASSVSLNNVFSSTYDNYQIVIETTASAGAYLNFRLRVGGVDASGSNYDWGFAMTSNLGSAFQLAGSSATSANICRPSATNRSMTSFTICNPAIARPTVLSGTVSYNDGATVGIGGGMGAAHSLSTAYDGFTIIHSGTVTGTVSVYGYTI
jgi:hypothetical protein